jgi:hypothetical protein
VDVNKLAALGMQISIKDTLKAQGLIVKEKDPNVQKIASESEGEGIEFVFNKV